MVGDFSLATGADQHVAFVARLLGRTANSLEWAWLIPASRIQLAAALIEAWQRPHPVACFGGFGNGVDDHTQATLDALQQGREDVGLPRHATDAAAGVMQVGNVAFFNGHPTQAHDEFSRWWTALLETVVDDALAREHVRWPLPESPVSIQARKRTRAKHPAVLQRLIAAVDGSVALSLSGASKGKVQAARKSLQAALKDV